MEPNKSMSLQKTGNQDSFVERMLQNMDSLDKAKEFGKFIMESGFSPKHYTTAEQVVLTIDAGMRIGFTWSQALQEGFIVNGIPGYKSKALKALVLSSGVCDKWETSWEGSLADKTLTHVITAHRTGATANYVRKFGIAEAERAGLWNKEGVWKKFPEIMLENRNTARVCDYDFSDVTKGFKSVEELQDYPTDFVTDDGLKVSSTKTERSQAITENAKVAGTGKGAPAGKRKIDSSKIEDANVVVEEKPSEPVATEKKDITTGIDQMGKEEIWKVLTDNIGFDPAVLFTEANIKTLRKVKALIVAIQDGTIAAHLKEKYPEYQPKQKAAESDPEMVTDESEIPEDIKEPGTEGRPMAEQVVVSDFLESKNANEDKIIEKMGDAFNDMEDFYKFATLEQISIAIKL